VDTLGTDHSPAPMELKQSADFFKVWGGIAGCQHGFPLTIAAGLLDHGLTAQKLSPLLSGHVAERFGINQRKGRIAAGMEADLVLMRLGTDDRIDDKDLLTRHRISAYTGMINRCRIERTLVRGRTVWPLAGGEAMPQGRWLKPESTM
jgi:allantoinase